jgi:hypothetical protein
MVRLGGASEDLDPLKGEAMFELPEALLRQSAQQVGVPDRDFAQAGRPASSQQRCPALHAIVMVWKDHQDLRVFHGRKELVLGREGSRASEGPASRVFGLLPGGAEVAWQAVKLRELDPPGQAIHSFSRGVMRKGMVRKVSGSLCRMQIDDREPSTSKPGSLTSPLAELSLGVDISGTLNGLVDFTNAQTRFQIQYHYHFANKTMKKSEIAENYSCPFCVQRHPSFEALKCHLLLCHDLFQFSFHGRGGIGSAVNLTTDPLVHDAEGRLLLPEAEVYRANHLNKEFSFFRDRKKEGGVPSPVTVRDVERYRYELAYVKKKSVPEAAAPTNEGGAIRGKRKIRYLEEDEVVGHKRRAQRSNNRGGAGAVPEAQVLKKPNKPVRRGPERGGQTPGQPHPVRLGENVYFHSRSYQPMRNTEALRDSESDLEEDTFMTATNDRYLLDEFEDVTQTEKKFMHTWNMFAHKHEMHSDAILRHQVGQFIRSAQDEFREDPGFRRCMSMHLINLWDRGILSSQEAKDALKELDALVKS